MSVRTISLAAGAAATLASSVVAQPYNGIADCERYATSYYKAGDPDFMSFVINPNTVEEITFDNMVGSQHVAAVWRGRGTYTSRNKKFTGTFICLHAGGEKGALFIYLFPR
jgi:hypothetical protein